MPKGDKTPIKYDWVQLYADFTNAVNADDRISLRVYCQSNGLSYTNTAREFAELSRLQVAEIGATLAPKAMRKLGALLQSKDENIAHKTSTAILDRTGFSPKEQIINVQTNISLGVALFSTEDMTKAKSMFAEGIIDEQV